MKNLLISLSNINKYVGSDKKTHILKNINLDIKRGEFIAIVGRSGSGKSTLLNILGCLDLPTSGKYYINDTSVDLLSSDQLSLLRNKMFGFIFQKYNLLSTLTSLENVALPAIYLGLPLELRTKRALSLLNDLGLEDKVTNHPSELSGGQQQRVSIARALMNGGEVLFADEPTGALDTQSGKAVMEILIGLHQLGHTIVLVTHNTEIAAKASRIVEIQDGKIISDSTNIENHVVKVNTINIDCGQQRKLDLFYESLRMSITSILFHKTRSLLTMLGIIIGIAAVISVFALGRGSQKKILADISAIGTSTLEIFPGKDFGDTEAWRIKTLSIQDTYSLKKLNFVSAASPRIGSAGMIVYNNVAANCISNGVNDKFSFIKGLKLSSGRFISYKDIYNIDSVVVLDYNAKDILFHRRINPLGKIVFLNKQPLKVIGIIEKNKNPLNNTRDINIYIPYTTMMYKISGIKNIDSIILKIDNHMNAQAAEKWIINFLIKRHDGVKDFYTINSDSIKRAIEKTTNTMTILISGIALISLIVGGIGVMNIMLVSVTERTAEIGLRMAIGAKRHDLLTQFLIEAVIICLLGGLIGIFISILFRPIFNFFIVDFTISYSFDSFVLALLFSTSIGVIFGYIPARNASLLNPIEAMGRE